MERVGHAAGYSEGIDLPIGLETLALAGIGALFFGQPVPIRLIGLEGSRVGSNLFAAWRPGHSKEIHTVTDTTLASIRPRRVVITGLGAVSSLANSADETWARIVAGETGIKRADDLDPEYVALFEDGAGSGRTGAQPGRAAR
jgi:hypothetical protein